MRPNRLRELLNAGKPSLGTHVLTPWPGMIEIVGHSGVFDYIEYVGEYSSFSLELLDNIGRAIGLFPNLSAMMKVDEQTRGFIAQRAIDAGIQNVLFTDCRSAEDVKECISYVRSEMPGVGGNHGAGMRRNVGYVLEGGSPAWVKAMDEVVVAFMIEKKGAVENLDEILAVDGVDMVQFGPTDYSVSIGKPGQEGSEGVREIEWEVIRRALRAGVHPRAEISTHEEAQYYLDLGVRHFCIGWDLSTIYAWCKDQGAAMRRLVGGVCS